MVKTVTVFLGHAFANAGNRLRCAKTLSDFDSSCGALALRLSPKCGILGIAELIRLRSGAGEDCFRKMSKLLVVGHNRPKDRSCSYIEIAVQEASGKTIRNAIAIEPGIRQISYKPPSAIAHRVIGQLYNDVSHTIFGRVSFLKIARPALTLARFLRLKKFNKRLKVNSLAPSSKHRSPERMVSKVFPVILSVIYHSEQISGGVASEIRRH